MSPDQYRSLLSNAGFSVARRSFPGAHGTPLYYVLELDWDGSRKSGSRALLAGRQYSIDLATGRWNRWGTVEWYRFEQGPWNEQAAECEQTPIGPVAPVPAAASTLDLQLPNPAWQNFLAECLACGFALEPGQSVTYINGDWPTGNVFARRNGQRYLISTRTRTLIDFHFEKHPLSEFVVDLRDESERAAEPLLPPLPRELPRYEYTGRSRQVNLF